MYSDEEKGWFIAQWLASGLSIFAFSKQPGNPGHRSLYKWRTDAEEGKLYVPELKVHGKVEGRFKHTAYPEATRKEALRLYDQGLAPGAIAKRLGILNGQTVTSWVRKRDAKKEEPLPDPTQQKDPHSMTKAELIEALEQEKTALAVVLEVMRDPKVLGLERLSNRHKTELGLKLKQACACCLTPILKVLGLSKSTFYDNAKALAEEPKRKAYEASITARITAAFEDSHRTYGYRRIRQVLAQDPHDPILLPERKIRKVMAACGLKPRSVHKAQSYSSYKGEVDQRAANLPLRADGTHCFQAKRPLELVVTDVTEFKVGNDKVYLSAMIDCFDGNPAAWTISTHPDARLCQGSLVNLILQRGPGVQPGLTVHSDGGAPYRSHLWKDTCEHHGITRSMSRKACCGDNARMEGFFGILKEEFYNHRGWSQVSVPEFTEQLSAYIQWYANNRLKCFCENGKKIYETIISRRMRLGLMPAH